VVRVFPVRAMSLTLGWLGLIAVDGGIASTSFLIMAVGVGMAFAASIWFAVSVLRTARQ
jgi:hypothetical protein